MTSPATPYGSALIELLGPSGVGKSTVLRAAQALRSSGARWLGPSDLADLGDSTKGREFRRAAFDDPALREFIDAALDMVHRLRSPPSSKVAALTMLRQSAVDHRAVGLLESQVSLVHDELLLHRAFSILPQSTDLERDATAYFTLAPLPRAAVVITADADTILTRIAERGTTPNCYAGLDQAGLRRAVENVILAGRIAVDVLRGRGLPVLELDASGSVEQSAAALHSFVIAQSEESPMDNPSDSVPEDNDVRERLLAASGSFRKKDGRHELRTRDVMYCAFSTPQFTVTKEEAQRDAARRLERFGIKKLTKPTTALDLGANAGAMLFEMNNLGLTSGLGVEYDQDKVTLATEIAGLSDLDNLRFEQGDIDKLEAATLGTFDIVFALAIEGHVLDPDRLYRLLGEVTSTTLYFEGNGRCDIEDTTAKLKAAGFRSVEYLGFCDDDVKRSNNNRPMLVAQKKKRGLFSRRRR